MIMNLWRIKRRYNIIHSENTLHHLFAQKATESPPGEHDVVNKNLMKGNVAIITGHNTYKIAGKEIADLLEDASIENSIFILKQTISLS